MSVPGPGQPGAPGPATRELARAQGPRGEVVLRARPHRTGDVGEARVVELRVNGVFVMDSVQTGTERALASTALAAVPDPREVLIGGLGLGFTAREVLADRRVARVVVAEIEDAVVGWMRDGTVPHGPAHLADERLEVVVADVARVVREASSASYDVVLLDTDNGPAGLVHDDNAALYQEAFLRDVLRVLRPGGVLTVWSAAPAEPLRERLASVFAEAVVVPLDVRLQTRQEQYWLYLATTTR